MNEFLGQLALSYLLLPLIAILFGVVLFSIAKKNKLLADKKVVLVFILCVLLMIFPAVCGFVDYLFVPYIYIILQIYYIIIGYCYLLALPKYLPGLSEKSYGFELLVLLLLMLISMLLFALVFNLCSELPLGLWASTCILPFIFVSLFRQAYRTYLCIPLEIYKIWECIDNVSSFDNSSIDSRELVLVDIEVYKDVNDDHPSYISAKAADTMVFGNWFQRFVTDYNTEYPRSQISYHDGANPYGWIFYVKQSFFKRRKYIDPDLTLVENNVKGGNTIIVMRVKREIVNE